LHKEVTPKVIPQDVKDKLLAIPGVRSIGLSLAGIEVQVKRGTKVPADIGGVKLIVIETDEDEKLVDYMGSYSPLRPGVFLNSGSVAFFVKWRGNKYAITASHLWKAGSWKIGSQVFQWDRVIGELERWIPYTEGANPREVIPADIASVRLYPNEKCSNRLIDGNITLTGFAEPKLGQRVFVVGRRTGMAERTITHVDYSTNIGGDFRLENAFRVDAPFIAGDSGGLVCTPGGKVVGLITASGSTYGVCSHAIEGMKALGMEDAELVREPDLRIELPIGKKEMIINGQVHQIDVPAQIVSGRTMVPLRFIAEVLGAEVDWEPKDGKTEKVIITKGG